MRVETQKDIYGAASIGAKYDEACKRVFQNKEIIAPILQMMVPEYQHCTVEEVIRCIDVDTISDSVPVEDIPANVVGLPTELDSVTEKLIRYDVHFKAAKPEESAGDLCVHLHIDLEVQNDYEPGNPSYPIIKRALYYAVRELSAQLGTLTERTNYADLEKVYSIWICNERIPKELQDTATNYTICKNDLIGSVEEAEENFDLLDVIIIRRGGDSREKIFDFLTAVFQGKLQDIEKYVPVKENETIRQEVETMSGLGASILERGYEQGIEQGIEQATADFVKRMLQEGEDLSKISLYSGCTMEQVQQIKEETERESCSVDLPLAKKGRARK